MAFALVGVRTVELLQEAVQQRSDAFGLQRVEVCCFRGGFSPFCGGARAVVARHVGRRPAE
ncbi:MULTISPECIES: hypothetical protein [unclassified Actinoplanes]|uniref:hypothetical protein n=1 Tax=unclassified Actinoplanes TaxID=2626549 RepID=UPI0012BA8845|nr:MULTISPECIES: hypothetical protein [unclassified Actinoplanes]